MERTEFVLTTIEPGAPAVLLRRPAMAPVVAKRKVPYVRSSKVGWRILAGALLLGVVGGVAAGLIETRGSAPKIPSHSVPFRTAALNTPNILRAEALSNSIAAPMMSASTTSAPGVNQAELSRLKARNRRLEALISVLRERKGSHAKSADSAR